MPAAKLKFCINASHEGPLRDSVSWWQACEKAGIDMYGVADSPIQRPDLYVASTLCALNTDRMRIASCVTNPVTRHPSVTASCLRALDELAPGRIAMGIATGDSALWGVGLKPATVASLREYILAVKGLIRGEAVSYRGQNFKSQFPEGPEPANIPVYVACSGPKVLKMASQVADGLIVTMGFSPEDISYVRGIIEEGCAEVGRNPDELDIWWNAYIVFAPSVEEAMEKSLGWSMSWITMTTLNGKGIPEEYKEPLRRLTWDNHDLTAAYKTTNRHSALVERAKEVGLYDWLISRSPRLFGTPDDIGARLEELAETGLTNWMFYITPRDSGRYDLLEKLSGGVMPRFA